MSGTIINSYRPDAFPLLTQKVYSLTKTSQERELLINRGMFPLLDLSQGEGDPLKHRLQGTISTWSGYEAFGGVVDTRLGPNDHRPQVAITNPGSLTYQTIPRGVESPISYQFEAERQVPIDVEERRAKLLRSIHAVQREYRIASTLRTSGNTSGWAAAGFTVLSSTDDPIGQFLSARDYIVDNSDVKDAPTHLVIDRTIARFLRKHPTFRGIEGDITKGVAAVNQDGAPVRNFALVEAYMSRMLEMDVKVATGRYNTAKEGQAASLSDIWSGAQFLWDSPGEDAAVLDSDMGGAVELDAPRSILCTTAGTSMGRYQRPDGRVYYVWMDQRVGETLIAQNLGWHFSSVVS